MQTNVTACNSQNSIREDIQGLEASIANVFFILTQLNLTPVRTPHSLAVVPAQPYFLGMGSAD